MTGSCGQREATMATGQNEAQAVTALNRFGLGARPGDLRAAAGDPRGFVIEELLTANSVDAVAVLALEIVAAHPWSALTGPMTGSIAARGVQNELPALGLGDRGGDRDLAAELVGRLGLAPRVKPEGRLLPMHSTAGARSE
jgi:hypothetical protein